VRCAPNATVEGVWIDDTGENLESQDAAVYVAENATGTTLTDLYLYLTDAAFGVWGSRRRPSDYRGLADRGDAGPAVREPR